MVEAAVPEHVSDVRHHGGHVAGRVGAKSIHLQRTIVEADLRVLHLAALLHLLLDLGRHRRLPRSCFAVRIPLRFVMFGQMIGDCTGC